MHRIPFGLALAAPALLACNTAIIELGPSEEDATGGSGGTPSSTTGAGGEAGSGEGGTGGIIVPQGPLASPFEWMNPKPHGNRLRVVDATSDANLWVGGRGEVLQWDGQDWTEHVPADDDIIYYALWTRSANDVWAGGTRLVWHGPSASEQPVLFHYTGGSWIEVEALGQSPIRALDGQGDEAFLLTEEGDVLRFVEGEWTPYAPLGPGIHALWISAEGSVWAVGDRGSIHRRTTTGWQSMTSTHAGDGEPFDEGHHYIGVWGAAEDDVWAIYETTDKPEGLSSPKLTDNEIGFAHWDGEVWTVVDTFSAHCTSADYQGQVWNGSLNGNPSYYAFVDWSSFDARRGALLAGRNSGEIIASIGGRRCLWGYDGTDWRPVHQQYGASEKENFPYFHHQYPFGNAPAVGATPTMLLVAGDAGRLASIDLEAPLPESPHTELSPRFSPLFLAERQELGQLEMHGDERYALADGRPSTWTASGWVAVEGPEGSLDPAELFDPEDSPISLRGLHKIHVTPNGTLWAFGGHHDAYAASFDGVAWQQVPVEPNQLSSYDDQPWSVTSTSDELLFSSSLGLWRLEDGMFRSQDLPGDDYGSNGAFYTEMDAFPNGDILVTRSVSQAYGAWKKELHRLRDGSYSLELAHSTPYFLKPSAFDDGRAMLTSYGSSESPAFLFDGTEWAPMEWAPPAGLTWLDTIGERVLMARNPDDIYMLGRDPRGSHLFHFNGTGWTLLFSADALQSMATDGEELWLIGPNGATARAALATEAK